MPDISPQDVANKLLSDGFTRDGPVASGLSDPIADTPMIVTLDEPTIHSRCPPRTRHARNLDARGSALARVVSCSSHFPSPLSALA